MFTIILALVSGIAVGSALGLTHLVHSPAAAIVPGLLATLAVGVLLLRRSGKLVEPVIKEAERHLTGGRRELALKSLRSALSVGRWNPLLEGQLRTQIGALLYVSGELDEAHAELSRAAGRPWESPAYLGCVCFKRHDEAGMVRAFERAVKVGKAEGLAWTIYAWCLLATSKRAEAAEVLKRAIKELPNDERLKGNLEAIGEGKKLKVAPYGERWAAFALDGAVPGVPKAARGFAQRPGFRQRPQRRSKR